MVLNNGQENVSVTHDYVIVKLIFELLDMKCHHVIFFKNPVRHLCETFVIISA